MSEPNSGLSVDPGLMSRRVRDVGLLIVIVGVVGFSFWQYRAAMPERIDVVAATLRASSQHMSAVGTSQNVGRATLQDGSEIDVLLPGTMKVTDGTVLEIERLTMRSGEVYYRAVPSEKNTR